MYALYAGSYIGKETVGTMYNVQSVLKRKHIEGLIVELLTTTRYFLTSHLNLKGCYIFIKQINRDSCGSVFIFIFSSSCFHFYKVHVKVNAICKRFVLKCGLFKTGIGLCVGVVARN